MRVFIIVISLISQISVSGQTASHQKTINDAVNKFSYLVFCKGSDQRVFIGVGFFIHLNRKLFFVTANHLAAGTTCDTLNIVLTRAKRPYKISVSDIPKQRLQTNFAEKDLLIIEINQKESLSVNSVEDLIPNYQKFDFTKVKEVVYFGFPKLENENDFDFKTTYPTKVLSMDTLIGSYNYFRFSNTLNKYDSVNYLSGHIGGINSGEGDSGAPVFFKVGNRFFFGGMCTSGVSSLSVTYVVRPEIILREIDKLSK